MTTFLAAAYVFAATPQATVQRLYNVISGPAGQKRDWDEFRSLFVEDATLRVRGPRNGGSIFKMTVESYVEQNSKFLEEQGFFEAEIASRSEEFAGVVHIWTTYESRRKEGEKPFSRGINSIQLADTADGWRIVSILWASESKDTSIPSKYLPDGGKF
jgi:hypothetical protein